MKLEDYTQWPCTPKEARQHMLDGGMCVTANGYVYRTANGYVYRVNPKERLITESYVGMAWYQTTAIVLDLMAEDWSKLVPKAKSDRFAEVDQRISCASAFNPSQRIELRELARAIVKLIEEKS